VFSNYAGKVKLNIKTSHRDKDLEFYNFMTMVPST